MPTVESISDDETPAPPVSALLPPLTSDSDQPSQDEPNASPTGLRHRVPLRHPSSLPSAPRSPLVPDPPSPPAVGPAQEPEPPAADEWFKTLILAMPFCFLYLLLDV